MESPNEIHRNYTSLIIFNQVAYTPVFIVGLVLNFSALWCFKRTPQWTDTHIYMLNLLLADFLLTLFLPFRIIETFRPMEPSGLCTFLICVHYTNMYSSIFTITAISIHRYLAVRFPIRNKSSGASEARRKKIASGTCLFIWLFVIVLCLIFSSNMHSDKLKTCYERKDDVKMSYQFLLVLEILGYLLPIVTITTCSTQTIRTLLKSLKDIRQHTEEEIINKRKNIIAIITANMVVFIVCFTPIHAGYLVRNFSKTSKTIRYFYDVSEWLATTNCCLDFVGYYFLLKNVFRAQR